MHNALDAADAPEPSAETAEVRARTSFGDVVISRPVTSKRERTPEGRPRDPPAIGDLYRGSGADSGMPLLGLKPPYSIDWIGSAELAPPTSLPSPASATTAIVAMVRSVRTELFYGRYFERVLGFFARRTSDPELAADLTTACPRCIPTPGAS